MSYLINFLMPTQLDRLLNQYFEVIRVTESLRLKRELSKSDQTLNLTVKRRLWLAHLAVLASCLHFIYLYFCPSANLTQAILNADIIYIVGVGPELNLLSVLYLATAHYYFAYKLFVTYHSFYLNHLYQVWHHSKEKIIFLKPYFYTRKMVKQVKQTTRLSLNFVMFIYIAGEVTAILLQCHGLGTIWMLGHHKSIIWLVVEKFFAFIYFELSTTMAYFYGFYIIYILTLEVGLTAMSITIGFGILIQIQQLCRNLSVSRSPSSQMAVKLMSILRYRRRNLILWLGLTPLHSQKLLGMLLLTVPCSCYLFTILLFSNIETEYIPLILAIIVTQWSFIFGLHGVFVRFNAALMQPNRTLFNVASCGHLPLRTTLALALHLDAFHTRSNRRYGFGYGGLGVVSRLSFSKSILMYGEFIIYTVRIIKRL